MKRTYIKDITNKLVDSQILLYGWINAKRDHGGVLFVDLEDNTGIIQLVIRDIDQEISIGSCCEINGTIAYRVEGADNKNLSSGDIECIVNKINILNKSKTLPFDVTIETKVSEEILLRYRYLHLRRKNLRNNITFRSQLYNVIRNFMYSNSFIEVETPYLTVPMPEGARDFLVKSRLVNDGYYALSQSPQLYKQMLMIGTIDKYYQIVRCFRDEDNRADRQPEFTQLDYELSFTTSDEVINYTELLMKHIWNEMFSIQLKTPFDRLTHNETLELYGTDKPDMRYGLSFKKLDYKFNECNIINKQYIYGIVMPNDINISRNTINKIIEYSKLIDSPITYFENYNSIIKGPLVKYMSEESLTYIKSIVGDNLVFVAANNNKNKLLSGLGNIRIKLAEMFNLINKDWKFVVITKFPMCQVNENGTVEVEHHPFTNITDDTIKYLDTDISKLLTDTYDLVLNGYEIMSGSIRINDSVLQKKVLDILNINVANYQFFLDALSYGAPPHGGAAIGLDRLLYIMRNCKSIRDVIAFPKSSTGVDIITGAPLVI